LINTRKSTLGQIQPPQPPIQSPTVWRLLAPLARQDHPRFRGGLAPLWRRIIRISPRYLEDPPHDHFVSIRTSRLRLQAIMVLHPRHA